MTLPSSESLRAQFLKLMAAMCLSTLVICASSGYNYYYYYGWEQTGSQAHKNILPSHQIFRTEVPTEATAVVPSLESIEADGKLMEPVTAKWERNVFFAIKSTTKFLTSRVRYLMLTWFQAVDKDMVSQIKMCMNKRHIRS